MKHRILEKKVKEERKETIKKMKSESHNGNERKKKIKKSLSNNVFETCVLKVKWKEKKKKWVN